MYIICMRIARTFTLDEDLIKKLNKSGKNRSELLNMILREYFDKKDILQMDKVQLKKELEKIKAKKEYEKKLKEIQNE